MSVIRASELVAPPGWEALTADLLSLDGRGDQHARRRGVVLRLTDAGVTPELLERLLPGWSRYLNAPAR